MRPTGRIRQDDADSVCGGIVGFNRSVHRYDIRSHGRNWGFFNVNYRPRRGDNLSWRLVRFFNDNFGHRRGRYRHGALCLAAAHEAGYKGSKTCDGDRYGGAFHRNKSLRDKSYA